VTIVDPSSTLIDVGVIIGRDSVIEPSTFLRGTTVVGERCTWDPLTTIIDSALGDEATVVHSYLTGARVGDGAPSGRSPTCAPTRSRQGAKAGPSWRSRTRRSGKGAKSRISPTWATPTWGEVELGAGTITANYDGKRKHRTTIGRGVRISVHTSLVAPVTVGDEAFTGAGSVITDDVPPRALGIARERQRNVEGYAERRK
jgi:bifunctional UDP-N-acetylglucosamine pyrophosphorylase/glucosamine-1-phosphate N-acetyltransferase